MPRLIRFYIFHCAIGFAIAAVFVAGLLWLDVANLGTLVASSPSGWLAVVVLWWSNGAVFAGVQFAIAIMGLPDRPDDHREGW